MLTMIMTDKKKMDKRGGAGMNAKEYLKQLQKMDVRIKQRQQEKDELRTMLGSISSFDYSKDRVQTGQASDAHYVKIIEKITEIEEGIGHLITEYLEKKHEMIGQIQKLKNDKHIEVLYKRYIEFKRIEDIAEEMNYTYPYAISLHGNALKEFEKENDGYF